MLVVDDVMEFYRWVMEEASDRRTSNWPLMSSPFPTLGLTMLYLFIVIKGPQWMVSRPAFNLKSLLLVYNFGLVILSIYMFYEFFVTTVLAPGFSLVCQDIDFSDDPNSVRLASVCWLYFISKIIEFMDTIIFVLRKKNNQISFLHVYHHTSMTLLWWIGIRFVAGGESYIGAMVNSFIHIIMYSYYFLSACGPQFQQYLWWKKYLTTLQLAQFAFVMGHTIISLCVGCVISMLQYYQLAQVFYMISFIILFTNFYRKTYIKKAHAKSTKNAHVHANGHITYQNGKAGMAYGEQNGKAGMANGEQNGNAGMAYGEQNGKAGLVHREQNENAGMVQREQNGDIKVIHKKQTENGNALHINGVLDKHQGGRGNSKKEE